MKELFSTKIKRFCKSNNITYEMQSLKFGFQRAVISCATYEQFTTVRAAAQKLKDVSCETICYFDGTFEGFINLMNANDKAELDKKLAEEQAKVEMWWQRYHNADEETRKLMRCGAIP